jgi:hypothetical protein
VGFGAFGVLVAEAEDCHRLHRFTTHKFFWRDLALLMFWWLKQKTATDCTDLLHTNFFGGIWRFWCFGG